MEPAVITHFYVHLAGGPGAPDWNGLRRLVKDAVSSGRLSYPGRPDAIRSYIHIDDAASATIDMLHEDYEDSTFVVGGVESQRVYDVLMTIGEILGISSQPEFGPQIDTDHYVRTPYAYKPTHARNFVPQSYVDLAQGIHEIISDLDSH